MKTLSFVLLVLVVSIILTNLPSSSYADPNLDTLLRIATQARDNINIQLSQLPTVPDEINQLYTQGSKETDALAQSVSQEDQTSSKAHFLSAMKIFKEINDKISSLTPAATSEQTTQISTLQLGSEINRIQSLGDKLKTIAITNNVEIDFTKFNQIMQDARKNLDVGNTDQVNKDLQTANQVILDVHQLLADAAKKKTSDRAKDFTEKQIQRLSQVNETSSLQNVTRSVSPPVTPVPEVTNGNQTGNIPDMIIQLRELVSAGKIDEALKLIKLIEALQTPKIISEVPTTETQNVIQPFNENNVNTPEITNPVNNPTKINSTIAPNQVILPPTLPANTLTKTNSTVPANTLTKTNSTVPANTLTKTNSTAPATSSKISLTVNSVDLSGNQIRGIWIELRSTSDNILKTGYVPTSFVVTSG